MPNALIISDSKELATAVGATLLKDHINTRIVKWSPLRLQLIKYSEYDYLLLLITKPSERKNKRTEDLIQNSNAKIILSTLNKTINERVIGVAKQKQVKIVLYDKIVDIQNINNNSENNYCVEKTELSNTIVKNLYGFADFKIIFAGKSMESKPVIPISKPETKQAIPNIKQSSTKYRKIIFVILIVLFLPYIFLFLLAIPLGTSYLSFKKDSRIFLNTSLDITERISNLGQSIVGLYTRIPLAGALYQQPLLYISTVGDAAELISLGMVIANDGERLLKNAVGEQDADVEQISLSLATNIDTMYRQLSFFEAEIKQLNPGLVKRYGIKEKISQYRPILQGASLFSRNLYSVLGGETDRTYLVLFQNNMELRPTGGFIGSIGLLSLDKGKLVSFNVLDVYDADGQLKGYVEPPEPISKYLGEENWYLRDSNWDPDFPTSAVRAEWFLDKSLQRDVDGVIAINLEVAKSILEVIGPVELDGYEDSINRDNLYEKVQYEVEENFFPGSRKKKNYLTALAQALVAKIEKANSEQLLALVKQVVLNAKSRDLQAYFNDTSAQEGTRVLGWSGEVVEPSCKDNCYTNWLSLIEANLGVNKANYNVTRKADLVVEIGEGSTQNTLFVKYTNTSDDLTRIPEKRYKNYLRLLIPNTGKLENVKLLESDNTIELDVDIVDRGDYKEIGILIEIEPTENKTVIFKWSEQYDEINKLLLAWDKQSGVTMPITIRLKPPQNKYLRPSLAFNLTEEQFVGYNSELSEQFRSLIVW